MQWRWKLASILYPADADAAKTQKNNKHNKTTVLQTIWVDLLDKLKWSSQKKVNHHDLWHPKGTSKAVQKLNIDRVYRLKSPVGKERMASVSTWTESKGVYLMRESSSKSKIILLCFKIFSRQQKHPQPIRNWGWWNKFWTAMASILHLQSCQHGLDWFSLVLSHDRLQLVDVGASEVGNLGGTR